MGKVFYETVGKEFVPIDSRDICGPYHHDGFNFGRVLEQLVFLFIIAVITVAGIYLKQLLATFTCLWLRRSSIPPSADSRMQSVLPLISVIPADNKKKERGDSVDSRLERISSIQST